MDRMDNQRFVHAVRAGSVHVLCLLYRSRNSIMTVYAVYPIYLNVLEHHDFSYSRPFSVDANPGKWSRASVVLCSRSFLIRKLCIIITTVNRHYYSDDEITSTFRMPENFYTTLGIDSKASETDIRKAYRKLAIKWHPDKNPTNLHVANEKFKAIAEAYEVLSDEGKRSQYDGSLGGRRADTQRYEQSSDPLRGFDFSSDYSGRRAQDIFDQFFSTFQNDFFDSPFPHQQFHQQQPQRGEGAYREHNSRDIFSGFGGSFGGDLFGRSNFFGGDPFSNFGHSMGQMSGSSTSSTYTSNGRSGRSVTTSTTYDRHGRAVTRKETTTHHPDGTSETVVENSVTESPQQVEYQSNYGRSSNQGAGMSIQSNSSSNSARNYGQSSRDTGFNDHNRNDYYSSNGTDNNTGYRNNGGTQPYGGNSNGR